MNTKRLSKTETEQECFACDGTGMKPGSTMIRPNLCASCNGHGVVVSTRNGVQFEVHKYEPEGVNVTRCAVKHAS